MIRVARLEIVARTTPEVLERVCRVLRHRGATLERLVLTTTGEAPSSANRAHGGDVHGDGASPLNQTRIDVEVHLRGDPELIVRQLARLPDVHLVRDRDAARP